MTYSIFFAYAIKMKPYPLYQNKSMCIVLQNKSAQQGLFDGNGAIGTYFQTTITADTGIVIIADTLDIMFDGLDWTISPALAAQFAFPVV